MQNLLKTSLLGVFTASVLTGCALSSMIKKSKDQSLTVTPSPLEVKGDSVYFSLNATLPAGLLRKNKIYSLKPTYKYGDQKVELPDFSFKASDYPKAKKESVKGSKVYAFAFSDPAMSKGTLTVQGIASNINGKAKKTKDIDMAQGTITTPRLVDYSMPAVQVDFGYTPGDELAPTTIDFFFEQGKSVLRPAEIKSTRGQFLDNFIASKNVTQTVAITGSHSPEGREAKNVTLSEDRAKVIEKYYRGRLAKFNYEKPAKKVKGKKGAKPAADTSKAKAIQFVTKSLIEDWRPFVDTLNAYTGFSEAEKNEILAIVNATDGSFADKELKLQALATYPKLFTEVYPKLRFAQTEILTLRAKKSDAEIVLLSKEAAQGNAESLAKLNEKELAYAATLTPDLKEREAIYRASIRKNDMWESHNNLAAIVIAQAQAAQGEAQTNLLTAAQTNLAISINKQENAYAEANLAVVKAMLGDLPAAKDAIAKAEKAPDAAKVSGTLNSLKGAIAVREGKYAAAITNLTAGDNSAAAAFDLGLAYVMTKDYSNAASAFSRAQTAAPGVAKYAYGSAIAATRAKQIGNASSELKKAFAKDPALKQRALGDAEFNTISGNDAFTNALK